MPNTGAWKAFERRVAGMLGTKRTPLSGAMSGHRTHSDTLHRQVYVEAKWLKGERDAGSAVLSLWDDTTHKAKLEGKIPLLAMHRRGSRVEFGAIPLPLACELLTWFLSLPRLKRKGISLCGNEKPHNPHPVRDVWELRHCPGSPTFYQEA